MVSVALTLRAAWPTLRLLARMSSSSSSASSTDALERLLQQVAAGEVRGRVFYTRHKVRRTLNDTVANLSRQVSPAVAAAQYRSSSHLEYEDVQSFAKIDTHRSARTGFPEVVYAEGKTSEQVARILAHMVRSGADPNVMATRVSQEKADDVLARLVAVRVVVSDTRPQECVYK